LFYLKIKTKEKEKQLIKKKVVFKAQYKISWTKKIKNAADNKNMI